MFSELSRFDSTILSTTKRDPFREGFLPYGKHRVYYAQYGNPDGKPVLRFHGGPGGSTDDGRDSNLIDWDDHMLVLFDQPGCGRSTPGGYDGEEGTTSDILAVADLLRKVILGDDGKWACVTGCSWGSTVALLYAQQYTSFVRSVCVSGVFVADERSFQWWWKDVGYMYPEVLKARLDYLGLPLEADWRDIANGFVSRGDDEEALFVLGVTESWTMTGSPIPITLNASLRDYMSIFMGYARNDFHLPEGAVMNGMPALHGVPLVVLNGRNDFCTPPFDAWRVADAVGVSPIIVPNAGHSLGENGLMADATKQHIGMLVGRVS